MKTKREGVTCQTVARSARSQKADADVVGRRTCTCGGWFFSSSRVRWPAMSKKLSRADALDNISAWDTEGVLCLLRKVSEVRRG